MSAELDPRVTEEELLGVQEQPLGKIIFLSDRHPAHKSHIKRNTFLGIAATVALGLGYTGWSINNAAQSSSNAMEKAKAPNADFVLQNQDILGNLTVGGSYDPRIFGGNLDNMHTKYGQAVINEALNGLEDLHRRVGVNSIRLSVAQTDVIRVNEQGKVIYDFSFYKPFIDYLMRAKGMRVTFNLGVKEARWPEQQEAEIYHQELLDVIARDGIIQPGDPIAEHTLAFENAFYDFLDQHYSREAINDRVDWQLENEPKYEYGSDAVKSSNAWLERSIVNNMRRFPDSKGAYKINSPGYFNVDEIFSFEQYMIGKYPPLKNRFELGVDYYLDSSTDTPIGKVNFMQWPYVGQEDVIAVNQIVEAETLGLAGNNLQELPQRGEAAGITTGVMEMGAWGWDGTPMDITDIRYSVLRCASLYNHRQPGELDFWGMDNWEANKNNPEYAAQIEQAEELVVDLNSNASK